MIIPYQQLAADTLYQILESYALREGTDYGEHEIPLPQKVAQLQQQLQRGEVLLVWSELHETVNLLSKQHWQQMQDPQAHPSVDTKD